MQRRQFVAATSAAVASIAGCSSLGSDGGRSETPSNKPVEPADNSAGATDVEQTLRLPVGEALEGQTLSAVSASYPRDRFSVASAQHEAVTVGVDSSGDGALDTEFGAEAISGVNTNDYSFTVTLDTEYELSVGDVVILDYPAVDNPAEPGEYEVTVRLNEGPEATATVRIE